MVSADGVRQVVGVAIDVGCSTSRASSPTTAAAPTRSPSVFGHHEVCHAFVCAAAACHYVAIALLVT